MPTAKARCEKKKILITGHGRGATKYAARLASCMGVPIRHEGGLKARTMAGKSSWYEAYPPARLFDYEHLILIMRDPWKVAVSSAFTLKSRTMPLRRQICGPVESRNRIELNARLVVRWYQMIVDQNPDLILKAEKCERKLFQWFQQQGMIAKKKKFSEVKGCLPGKRINKKTRSHMTIKYPWSQAKNQLGTEAHAEMVEMRRFWSEITE